MKNPLKRLSKSLALSDAENAEARAFPEMSLCKLSALLRDAGFYGSLSFREAFALLRAILLKLLDQRE